MSDNSYRIRVKVGEDEKVVKFNLKQGIKVLNILSLEINTEDEYDIQTSDYGVIVGRVLANDSFGVPNVKVSVFVPIENADMGDYIISNEYPYLSPQSRNRDGIKYNLLQKTKNTRGSFPSKRMLLDNDGCVEVFDKYWKYTTTTNNSGDYMIFGVPTGTCQVHYDCDLSDVGIISQHPYDFVAKGYNKNLFKSMSEFGDAAIETSVHVISQDNTVYVYPFWGDKEKNRIGITRNDIKINYKFEPSCVFMGSLVTDPHGGYIDVDGCPNGTSGRFTSLSTASGNIEVIRKKDDGTVEELTTNVKNIIDGNGVWCYQIPMNLDRIGTDEYGNTVAVRDPNKGIPTRARVRFRISLNNIDDNSNGEHTAKMLIPCNPELVSSGFDYEQVFTIQPNGQNEHANFGSDPELANEKDFLNMYEFGDRTPDSCFRDLYWGKVYSIKQYYPRIQYDYDWKRIQIANYVKGYNNQNYGDDYDCPINPSFTNFVVYADKDSRHGSAPEERGMKYNYRGYPPTYAFKQSCISSIDMINGLNTFPYNTMYAGAEIGLDKYTPEWFFNHSVDNSSDEPLLDKGLHFCFENDWINGCLYFPRIIITKDENGDFDYFGKRGDYKYTSISGRHCWHFHKTHRTEDDTPPVRPYMYYDSLSVFRTDTANSFAYYANDCINLDKISVYSRVALPCGIIKKHETNLGENVFYYKCGDKTSINPEYNRILSNNGKYKNDTYYYVYRRLYSTDIILLGNIENIYDNLPPIYNNIPSSTSLFPPIAPPKTLSESGMSKQGYKEQIITVMDEYENEISDIYSNTYKLDPFRGDYIGYTGEYSKPLFDFTISSFNDGMSIENYTHSEGEEDDNKKTILINLARRYSLFFCLRRSETWDLLGYDIPSFVNLSRICELDVHNDSAFNIERNVVIPVNGIIDGYDIGNIENRSAFATMNYNINKYVLNELGNRQYAPTPMVINGLDGRLDNYCRENGFYGVSAIDNNNKFNLAYEKPDSSYIKFRFGNITERHEIFLESEYYFTQDACRQWYDSVANDDDTQYDGLNDIQKNYVSWLLNYANGPIYLTENSFYFYFGLRSGFSALDALRERFIGIDEESGSSKKSRIVFDKVENSAKCIDGYQNVDYDITFYDVSFPVSWSINKPNRPPIKNGVFENPDNEDVLTERISEIPVGSYIFNAVDAQGIEYEQNLNVLADIAEFEYTTYFSQVSNLPVLEITEINGMNIYSATTIGNTLIISFYEPHGDGTDWVTGECEIKFNEDIVEYENVVVTNDVIKIKVKFDYDVNNVKAICTITKRYGEEVESGCIESYYNINLASSYDTELKLNNIPVKYIKVWRDFTDDNYEVELFSPDYGISQPERVKIWDSVATLHPNFYDSTEVYNRCFVGLDEVDEYKQLEYYSDMFSCVNCDTNMSIIKEGDTYETLCVTLSPNLNTNYDVVRERYYNPQKPESQVPIESGDTIYEETDVTNIENVIGNREIPHIVGSNYPRGMYGNGESMIKIGDVSWNGYVNNPTITKKVKNDVTSIFGINFFGCRSLINWSLDEPSSGNSESISGVTPQITSYSLGNYDFENDVYNMVGVRTIDRRFDYQFSLHTPLTLPSGYENFTENLVDRSLEDGSAWIDLYGGIRLNYSGDTKELTSYRINNNLLEGGPQMNETVSGLGDIARLYSVSVYDGNYDISDKLNEEDILIWYNDGNTDDKTIDIDHVVYSVSSSTENVDSILKSDGNFYANFVSCSTDFKDFQVKSGNTENINISYKSGVIINRSESDTDYDINYSFSLSANSSTTLTSLATFSGTSLSLSLAYDDVWGGDTYTDISTSGTSDYNVSTEYSGDTSTLYPEWARRGDFEKKYSNAELAMYSCSILNGNIRIWRPYRLMMVNKPSSEIYGRYDVTKYVSPYYSDSGSDIPMSDRLTQNNIYFKIDPYYYDESQELATFLMIPTKKIYKNGNANTSLKQGVVFNRGYVYYSSPIDLIYNAESNTITLRLFTPLRDGNGNVNYSASTLTYSNTCHTIGNIVNVRCPQAVNITYNEIRAEISLIIGDSSVYDVYFDIENGMRYHVGIDFTMAVMAQMSLNSISQEDLLNEISILQSRLDAITVQLREYNEGPIKDNPISSN